MQILHLTLKRKWFDLIAAGEKVVEYREVKPYWESRLIKDGWPVLFDEIHFKNGYAKNAPFMRVKHVGAFKSHSDKIEFQHGENMTGLVFCLYLGEIFELRA